jgi:hypothetical protein
MALTRIFPFFRQLPFRKNRLTLLCKIIGMKNFLCCFFLSLCCICEVFGQNLSIVDSNKYRIELPEYWKPGNRVWKILTDKFPLVCNEIKDKEICGDDCNPLYRIEFEMSEPVIFEYLPNHISSSFTNNQFRKPSEVWEIQTLYGFECSLLLRNEKGEIITRYILVDTNEVWKISNRVTLASYSSPPITTENNRRNRTGRYSTADPLPSPQTFIPVTGQEGETPYAYINRNREKLTPAYRDMYAIVDMKFNSW